MTQKIMLITGGSRGIGAATAILAAKRGYIVCINYIKMHASGGDPERVKRLASTLPIQRGGQPEEVATAILWLLSEEASYVTGTFIDVSGGR